MGQDSIPDQLAKIVLIYYIKRLSFLVNQSFHDGNSPDGHKFAKVNPIYKSGSTMDLSNY